MDPLKTFRFDPQNGLSVVSYADYPNGAFDNHFGLLYYDKVLTNYKVRIEYRFQEPQAKSPPSWGKNNSGLMLFCTDPRRSPAIRTSRPPSRSSSPEPERGRQRELPRSA